MKTIKLSVFFTVILAGCLAGCDSPERIVNSPERGVKDSPERIVNSPERDNNSPERDDNSPERDDNSPELNQQAPQVAQRPAPGSKAETSVGSTSPTPRPLAPGQKMARCVIKPDIYKGQCVFHSQKGGSFSISKRDQSSFDSNISTVSVTLVGNKQAEVFGLTTAGINSRWGPATRSKKDPACWSGADFEICAY